MGLVHAALLCLTALFVTSTAALAAGSERQGSVHRGFHPGGMWVELGDDGAGAYALSILDGMPGFAAEPLTVPMREDPASASCRLIPLEQGVAIFVEGCPTSNSFSATITIGGASGVTILQPVGWSNSFAWASQGARPLGPIRQSCAMARLRQAEGIAGTAFHTALSTLTAEAAALPAESADPSQILPRLRAERLRIYSILQLTTVELDQAQRIEDAIAGRPVLGRRIAMAEATRQKMEFDARVTNSPQRAQARQDLLQVDRALAEIYDVAAARRRSAALDSLVSRSGPGALSALRATLGARQPASIIHLLGLESVVGELDACLAALEPANPGARAHEAVRTNLVMRAGEIADMVRVAVSNTADSSAAAAALAPFEGSQLIRQTLQAGGHGAVLAEARGRVTQLAQAEDAARRAEERRMAQAVVPPSAGAGRGFPLGSVSRSVVLVALRNSTGSGFIVAPNIVVTNVHVVEQTNDVVVLINGERGSQGRPGRVIARYPIHDIAIIRAENLGGQIARIAGSEVAQGSTVWALGFPGLSEHFDRGPVYSATLTQGIVSRPIYDGVTIVGQRLGTTRLVQHTADTAPGSSGGPIFDACGRVIAVHAQATSEGTARATTSVWAGILPELLRQAGVRPSLSSSQC